MRLDTVVVGYDGSATARKAVEAAIDLTSEAGTVHVVTAYEEPSAAEMRRITTPAPTITGASLWTRPPANPLPDEYKENLDLRAGPRGYLAEAEAVLEAAGVAHVGHFVEDRPAHAILDVAEAVGAELVIVGSRGMGRVHGMLRGSVSSHVAAHAPHSFMVIHDHDEDERGD